MLDLNQKEIAALARMYRANAAEFAERDQQRMRTQSPYAQSTSQNVFKNIPIRSDEVNISLDERKQIEDYFDEFLACAYDFTGKELMDTREMYVTTFKSMMGDMSFTEWLESVTPTIQPWTEKLQGKTYLYSTDREGLGVGK